MARSIRLKRECFFLTVLELFVNRLLVAFYWFIWVSLLLLIPPRVLASKWHSKDLLLLSNIYVHIMGKPSHKSDDGLLVAAAVGLYLRLRPVAVAITDRPTEDRDLGHVLEMRPDRRTAESLRGLGLHWNGLSHFIHQLNILGQAHLNFVLHF